MRQLLFEFLEVRRAVGGSERRRRGSKGWERGGEEDLGSHLERDRGLELVGRGLLRSAGCVDLDFRVVWNHRLRTTAGLACWGTRTVALNPRLREVSEGEVDRTLRHELAHFLAQWRAGRRKIAPHGEEWRKACCDLGIPGERRCHDLPFRRVRMERRYFYRCPGCGLVVGRVRRMGMRVACLRCCRRWNGGKYDRRFCFVLVEGPVRRAA